MADDLKRQRAELERTQRLEAWADMARQVAHDIKNPLTPIQLSAEHARRVNIDRGRPLSPVLDDCVNAILTQVGCCGRSRPSSRALPRRPRRGRSRPSLPAIIEEVVVAVPHRARRPHRDRCRDARRSAAGADRPDALRPRDYERD